MKTVMILWAFNFFALPLQANVRNLATISMQQNQVELVSIFEQIEQQAHVSFIYNNEVKDLKRKINVNYRNRSVESVMGHLAESYGLGYNIQNSNITVYLNETPKPSAQRTINGTVKDDMDQPLMGANVRVMGSTNGVITDFDGNFLIQATNGDVLEFSYIGMQTQTYTVQDQDSISIILESGNQELNEVVVIGYGEKTMESLSAAVSKVDVSALGERPLSNAAVALQGVTPGLTITRSNGRPTDTPNINIRGFTSINGGEPLIIIDGVEGDINDINPSDIENISVLKDAGAAAIYGARASFGVVLITTKQAKQGDLTVSFEATTAINQVTTNTDFVTDPYEAIQIADSFFQASSGAS
ncbi:MAG: TonB-dependent receptor plug domain-containing protein [Flavobacteriaceae bacterium]|nr:TonB-dependent receptor plug domain-containing protein [Flavobacteriaceae bacterium]